MACVGSKDVALGVTCGEGVSIGACGVCGTVCEAAFAPFTFISGSGTCVTSLIFHTSKSPSTFENRHA